jgi:hypothetical protein
MLYSNRPKTNKPFGFENWWIMEHDFMDVAKQSWDKSNSRPFHHKTKYLSYDLKKWRKAKPNLSTQLTSIENLILQQQSKPPHQQDFNLQKQLATQHSDILNKNEEFHLQRAKKNWAKLGDRNTAYFHQAITKRNRKNTIAYLYNPDGTAAITLDQLATTLLNYFHDIYDTTSNSTNSNLNLPLQTNTTPPASIEIPHAGQQDFPHHLNPPDSNSNQDSTIP